MKSFNCVQKESSGLFKNFIFKIHLYLFEIEQFLTFKLCTHAKLNCFKLNCLYLWKWIWHFITYGGWYALKLNKTKLKPPSIGIVELGYHWSKRKSAADMTSYYERFRLYPHMLCTRVSVVLYLCRCLRVCATVSMSVYTCVTNVHIWKAAYVQSSFFNPTKKCIHYFHI